MLKGLFLAPRAEGEKCLPIVSDPLDPISMFPRQVGDSLMSEIGFNVSNIMGKSRAPPRTVHGAKYNTFFKRARDSNVLFNRDHFQTERSTRNPKILHVKLLEGNLRHFKNDQSK